MVAKAPDVEFYDVEEGKGATAPENLKRENANMSNNVVNSLGERQILYNGACRSPVDVFEGCVWSCVV